MTASPLVFDFDSGADKAIRVSSSGTRKLWPGNPLPFWFNVDVQESTEILTEGTDPTPTNVDDWYGIQTTSASFVQRYTIKPLPAYPGQPEFDSVSYFMSDDTRCTIDEDGMTHYLDDGFTTVDVTCTVGGVSYTRRAQTILNFIRTNSGTEFTEVSPRTGTVRENATDAIDDAIAGKDPSVAKHVFTDNTWTVRNVNCWLAEAGYDLTCCSPWNSRSANRRAGTLITPRHILNAAHYQLQVGDVVRFVTLGNVVIERTIIGKRVHPDYSPQLGYQFDFCVYTLDADVPDSLSFAKILPDDYEEYLPTGIRDFPVLYFDQEEKALVANGFFHLQITRPPEGSQRAQFYETPISGDSGNPLFILVDGEPILLSVFTFPYGGSFITNSISAINQMIEDSDLNAGIAPTGYSLTTCDLSPFMSFT